MGYALIEQPEGGNPVLIDSSTIETRARQPFAIRLLQAATELDSVISNWEPSAVAVEEVYFSKNVKTAIKVAHARGVVMEHAARAGLEVAEFSPTMVKKQLTGNGQADKQQVAFMVRRMVVLDNTSRLDDELDAIAVALCYAMRAGIREELK